MVAKRWLQDQRGSFQRSAVCGRRAIIRQFARLRDHMDFVLHEFEQSQKLQEVECVDGNVEHHSACGVRVILKLVDLMPVRVVEVGFGGEDHTRLSMELRVKLRERKSGGP